MWNRPPVLEYRRTRRLTDVEKFAIGVCVLIGAFVSFFVLVNVYFDLPSPT